MIGIILFGVASILARVHSRIALAGFILGGILFNLPPGPVPHLVLVVGGVIWGAAVIWLGYGLWTQTEAA